MTNYDIAIIGSGPGGYVAALYASHLKLKTCVIERDLLGGTCLNRGCIPTKALLNSASIVSTLKDAATHGIEINGYTINFHKMLSRKEEVVTRLRTGIETLFRANKIDLVRGTGEVLAPGAVRVDGKNEVSAKNIIVASGSRVAELQNINIDEKDILSSDGMLNIKELPKSVAIIGGGVIGCEFATLFNALGSKVTIIEFMDRLIPGQSREISKKLEMLLKKRGVDVFTSNSAESVTRQNGLLKLALSGAKTVEAEKILVAVGRKSNIEGLGLEAAGIKTEKGRIKVDEYLRTNIHNIFAIGDCVAGPLLAHKASYDGMLACDNILSKPRTVDYTNVPSCIWTDPEIASVGLSEEEAKTGRSDVKIAKFPYLASGKAFIKAKTEGFIKIVGDAQGSILGVEIFGEGACDLIAEAVLARTAGINIEQWSRVVHGHPTLSEIVQEAVHQFCGTPIHGI